MLESNYKSPWRKVQFPADDPAPTIAQIYALAGGNPVTVGFALGSGGLPAGVNMGGIVSYCGVPWGACAIAAARIVRSGSRLLASVAKSALGGLRVKLPGEDTVPASLLNAPAAIPALDVAGVLIYGQTVPWWPVGEAYAKAGIWMRRRSWEDTTRRMRFEAGAGTTLAVAVALDEDRAIHGAQLNVDFTASEFLADDWESYESGEPPAIDVTDFRIGAQNSRREGFYFAVDGAPVVPGPPEPPAVPGPPELPPTPPTGVFVRMVVNGQEVLAPLEEFACAGG